VSGRPTRKIAPSLVKAGGNRKKKARGMGVERGVYWESSNTGDWKGGTFNELTVSGDRQRGR